MYYKNGFYFSDGFVPEEACEISEETYRLLIEGQSQGKQIVADERGFPILIEPQPSKWHKWDGKSWVTPPENQAQIKAEQQAIVWERIKQKREQNTHIGCYVSSVDKWFHTDINSRQQYIFMRTLSQIPPKTMWKTMDNSFVEMTKALLDELSLALFTQEQADFANAERHRLQMLATESPLDYDFSDGWSTTYGN